MTGVDRSDRNAVATMTNFTSFSIKWEYEHH